RTTVERVRLPPRLDPRRLIVRLLIDRVHRWKEAGHGCVDSGDDERGGDRSFRRPGTVSSPVGAGPGPQAERGADPTRGGGDRRLGSRDSERGPQGGRGPLPRG